MVVGLGALLLHGCGAMPTEPEELGSTGEYTWERLGLYGGYVGALAAGPGGWVYAKSSRSLYRSSDGGETWSPAGEELQTQVWDMAVSASGHVFAATSYSGVFRSTDNGWTWTKVNRGMTDTYVHSLAFNDQGHLFAAARGHVFRSLDNGNSWAPAGPQLTTESYTGISSVAVSEDGYVFAATSDDGIARSMDNGDTWEKVLTNCSGLTLGTSGTSVFAGTDRGLFRSRNSGDTWESVGAGVLSSWVTALAVCPSGTILAGSPQTGLFRSTDNGDSWSLASRALRLSEVMVVVVGEMGRVFIGTSEHGVYRSDDEGATWTQSSHGIGEISVPALAIDGAGRLLASTSVGLFSSGDQGETWALSRTDTPWLLVADDRGRVYMASFEGLLRTSNGGANWGATGLGLPNPSGLRSLAVGSDGTLYAGLAYGLYRSPTSGTRWLRLLETTHEVRSVLLGEEGTVYAGTGGQGVYRSVDGGTQWKQRKKDFHSPDITALIATGDGSVLAGTEAVPESVEEFGPMGDGKYAGVYRSTNEGGSWKRMLNQRMDSVWAFAMDADGGIVVGCTDRVARSADDGASWVDLDFPLDGDWYNQVLSLAADVDGVIFAGTKRGLYRGSRR
ncbi:WD40/YVTN/BNR-like repeat-containing protein [Candidatus Latescibacterota bacterium]